MEIKVKIPDYELNKLITEIEYHNSGKLNVTKKQIAVDLVTDLIIRYFDVEWFEPEDFADSVDKKIKVGLKGK